MLTTVLYSGLHKNFYSENTRTSYFDIGKENLALSAFRVICVVQWLRYLMTAAANRRTAPSRYR